MPRKRKARRARRSDKDLRNATVSGTVAGVVRAVIDWLRDLL
ncbi:hypothetical protein ACFYWX_20675 [Streptomyces sp. NPDC002888]